MGKRILEHCHRRSWSLSRLARESAVPIQTLHGWTLGRKAINLAQLRKVAQALNTSIYELAFGEPDPHHSASRELLKELFRGDVRVTIHRIEKT